MAAFPRRSTRVALLALTLATGVATGVAPQAALAQAQSATAQPDDRMNRIETQLRALQRAVFPGGDQRFFEPEISADAAQPGQPQTAVPGASTTALTDVLARLDAMEQQLARLTAASEISGNALTLLQGRVDTLEAARVVAVTTPAPITGGAATTTGSGPAELVTNSAITTPAAGPTPERLAAVRAILKPATADAGDDEYTYGYRLWDADFYPEAQQQLSLFLERYPDHARESFARNLLGRAYLDNGEPEAAGRQFLANYLDNKQGARAPDSLLFLVEATLALNSANSVNRACIALAEFNTTYPEVAAGRLKTQYDALRARVTCP